MSGKEEKEGSLSLTLPMTRSRKKRGINEVETAVDNLEELSSDNSDSEDELDYSLNLLSSRIKFDFSHVTLKEDAFNRPIWVCFVYDRTKKSQDNYVYVFLETFHHLYRQAYDFLIAIADPVSRPQFLHEYKITEYSLYAATSLGLKTNDIISTLEFLSKVPLESDSINYIKESTLRCGKVKLFLDQNNYFLESIWSDILLELKRDYEIKSNLINPSQTIEELAKNSENTQIWNFDYDTGLLKSTLKNDEIILPGTEEKKADQAAAMGGLIATAVNSSRKSTDLYAVQINPLVVEDIRKRCTQLKCPLLEEYDFRRDKSAPDIPINLKPSTQIRDYQEKSLSKMFGNGRARSGLIVLPCGAGKTLVGITAMSTIKKSTIVFCTTTVAVVQWKQQIKLWTLLGDDNICLFTSEEKDLPKSDAVVIITTYNMVSYHVNALEKGQTKNPPPLMKKIMDISWGLVILDEVQVAPAEQFRKCISSTHSYCKLGLTATLVREDSRIEDLYFLVGPKLYEANWLDLQDAGYIATVNCVEVWCPMTPEFYKVYLQEAAINTKQLLYVMNPNKIRTCQHLIKFHEERGDKILVFCGNIFALKHIAKALNKPLLYGDTPEDERRRVLDHLKHDPNFNCVFISKIGDNSIDLPDVNVIIQISSHFASRRQEAQRLGRILRPKPRTSSRFNAFFYTLVSKDTKEMFYATKRQRFLVDQGYSFEVISEFKEIAGDDEKLLYSSKEEQKELLSRIMTQDYGEEMSDDFEYDSSGVKRKKVKISREKGQLSDLSGADGLLYTERNRKPRGKPKARPKLEHPLFQRVINFTKKSEREKRKQMLEGEK